MKKPVVALVCLIFFLFPSDVISQPVNDAFVALKKLEARVQSGIAYRDYKSVLGETKFYVNMCLENPEVKKNPELASIIGRIMIYYEQAGFVFKEKLGGPFRYLDHLSSYSSPEIQQQAFKEQQLFKSLLEQYPEANSFIEDGGALDRDKSDMGNDIKNLKYGRVLRLDYLLPIIFKRASEELKNASILLRGY